jgi:hypothetical protein
MSIAPAERVETSLEEIAALDFEPDMKCEWEHGDCSHSAKWWSINPCCNSRYLGCDPHVMDWLRHVDESPYILCECVACGSVLRAISLRFVPIGKP